MSSIHICVSNYAPIFAMNLLMNLVNDVKGFLQKITFD